MKLPGEHQTAPGRLMYVDEVRKDGENRKRSYYLCLCDCGNWYICRSDAFNTATTKNGCHSCGCLNKESYMKTLFDPDIQKRKIDNRLKNLNEKRDNLVGTIIQDWYITDAELQTRGEEKVRTYIKGICPYCKKKSGWIRLDGIISQHTRSCGCFSGSYGEEIIKNILIQNNIPFKQEKTFATCISPETKAKLRFDFYVNNQYLIEFDGIQHTNKGVSSLFTQEMIQDIQKRDYYKNQWTLKNNIPLIRIPYNHLKKICLEDLKLETTKFLWSENGK